MALAITGQRTPKAREGHVAACAVAPVVPIAEINSLTAEVNQRESSGKQINALAVVKDGSGNLVIALGSGDKNDNTWQKFKMSTAITPATVAALAFGTDLGATVSVAVGAALTLTTAVTGGVPSYKYMWFKNGALIPSATAATFTVASAAAGDAGKYKVIVEDSRGHTITSKECTVTVA